MSTLPSSPAPYLDQPLPPALTGSSHSLFTRYRRYPVFSRAWARGRTRVWASVAALLLLATGLQLARGEPLDRMPLGAMLQIAIQVLAPLLLGPWLGACIRSRGLPERREQAALVAMMLALVLALLAFHQFGAEPLKQGLAEATGAVDESGRRRRVGIAIGMMLSGPEYPASAAAPSPPETTPGAIPRLTNGAISALLTFWLGGGAALWGWRRERRGLATLAREAELARAQAQRREAELQLSVLAAQVEPHFLFNTLAGVRSAIATDPARASDMIDRLVDYRRAAIPRLRSNEGSTATLGVQLEIVRAYLGLMSARLPRLRWRITAAPELLAAPCPPWMLISLAENAVKHGVEPKIGPAQVEVQARRDEDGRLEVTVADDGAGFGSQAAGSGLGLSNIRQRLRQMYGEQAALTLKARPTGGVAATLTLPME